MAQAAATRAVGISADQHGLQRRHCIAFLAKGAAKISPQIARMGNPLTQALLTAVQNDHAQTR